MNLSRLRSGTLLAACLAGLASGAAAQSERRPELVFTIGVGEASGGQLWTIDPQLAPAVRGPDTLALGRRLLRPSLVAAFGAQLYLSPHVGYTAGSDLPRPRHRIAVHGAGALLARRPAREPAGLLGHREQAHVHQRRGAPGRPDGAHHARPRRRGIPARRRRRGAARGLVRHDARAPSWSPARRTRSGRGSRSGRSSTREVARAHLGGDARRRPHHGPRVELQPAVRDQRRLHRAAGARRPGRRSPTIPTACSPSPPSGGAPSTCRRSRWASTSSSNVGPCAGTDVRRTSCDAPPCPP